MKQALLIVDIQASFLPPDWLIKRAAKLSAMMTSIATVERHDEDIVRSKLNWTGRLLQMISAW